jgi:biotin carboxyl carrier protein
MTRGARDFTLTLDGTSYKVIVDGNSILVNGQPFVVGFENDKVIVDGSPFDVKVEGDRATIGGIAYELAVEGLAESRVNPRAERAVAASEGAVTAIMPGKVIRMLVGAGDEVAEGDVICILEAMKMENELKAPRPGRVGAVYVQPGQDVEMGAVLAEIE